MLRVVAMNRPPQSQRFQLVSGPLSSHGDSFLAYLLGLNSPEDGGNFVDVPRPVTAVRRSRELLPMASSGYL